MAMFNGYSAAEMKAIELAWRNAQPMKGECSICNWEMLGTAAEVLEAQKKHRFEHGITKQASRRNLRSLSSFKQNTLTEEDLTDIERERRRRAILTGVEITTE